MRSELVWIEWFNRTVSFCNVFLVLYSLVEARAVVRVHFEGNSLLLVVFTLHEVLMLAISRLFRQFKLIKVRAIWLIHINANKNQKHS